MFTWALIIVAVVAALSLVFLVLLHSGRGGGVSGMLGGGVASAASGSTVAERNLDRITIAVSLVFILSVLALDLRLQ
jgi:preprotein translocase subunit SecG